MCWPQLPGWEISVCRGMSSFSWRKLQGKHGLQRTARFQPRQELGEYLEREKRDRVIHSTVVEHLLCIGSCWRC